MYVCIGMYVYRTLPPNVAILLLKINNSILLQMYIIFRIESNIGFAH